MYVRRTGAALAAAFLTLVTGSIAAPSAVAAPPAAPAVDRPGPAAPWNTPMAESSRSRAAIAEECHTANDGATRYCVGPEATPAAKGVAAAAALAPGDAYPSYCQGNVNVRYYLRNEACRNYGFYYRVLQVINGVETEVGRTTFRTWEYTFMDTRLNSWTHELTMAVVGTSPRTATATLSGFPFDIGDTCNTLATSEELPPTPLVADAVGTGRGRFRTTVTAVGAIGTCTSQWGITIRNPGVTDFNYTGFESLPVRCDNATGGNPRTIGCVIPTYPQPAVYYRSQMPQLADHVLLAQQSGLPGGTMANPLTKADAATQKNNRDLACGPSVRPSIPGLSCDEYPPATARQGLTSGGSRRTFDNCNFDSLPRTTGPTGVSVCMVPEGQQDLQGNIHSQLTVEWRVLPGDPWRVVVLP